jgi:hypothetical protein
LDSGKRTGTSRTVPQSNGINPGQSGQVQNPSGSIE